MDPIKEAFAKIKQDIDQLRQEMNYLRQGLLELYDSQTQKTISPTEPELLSNKNLDNQTDKLVLEGLKSTKNDISIGNEGVPTDRQTDQQTDKIERNTSFSSRSQSQDSFQQASRALASLDQIKKQIRLQFKRLTQQEMLVFSALYSLEEENSEEITYQMLAQKLSLSQSSIRDYIARLINKGVPINKKRLQNKTILLEIDQNLKNIASLETILRLRDL